MSSLIPPFRGNWGDRDFIAAGAGRTVYVTWDYGPTAAAITIICSPIGSCSYTAGDVNAVIQKSTDGGKTWATPVKVDPQAGSIALTTWWIDGDLGMDSSGNLYATWDTQTSAGDIGWLAYSTDRGRSWSSPRRVTEDRDNATHIVQVAGAGSGVADVAWQADNSPRGYATFLRSFSITGGWLEPAIQVSDQ